MLKQEWKSLSQLTLQLIFFIYGRKILNMINAENIPLILTAVVTLLSSLCWPIIVISTVIYFRKDIHNLLNRLQTAKLPGGAEASFQFGELAVDKPVKSAEEKSKPGKAEKAITTSKVNWGNSGNMYWLGHDLMWTIDAVLRGGDRNVILHGLNQAVVHTRGLGLENTSFEERLIKLIADVEKSLLQDWSAEKRMQFAKELNVIKKEIGDLLSSHQSDYGK